MDTKIILDKLEDAVVECYEMVCQAITEERANYWGSKLEGLQQAINIIKLNEKREETK